MGMGSFIIALCALIFLAILGLAAWAVLHSRPADTDPVEREWMDAIR
jgi:hypothetical protein